VRKHVENIYKKLQVHNKLEAIQKAKENNIL
jgi:DNA-binding NarL/FixJ family response regulator